MLRVISYLINWPRWRILFRDRVRKGVGLERVNYRSCNVGGKGRTREEEQKTGKAREKKKNAKLSRDGNSIPGG